jgi:hypothetical protein
LFECLEKWWGHLCLWSYFVLKAEIWKPRVLQSVSWWPSEPGFASYQLWIPDPILKSSQSHLWVWKSSTTMNNMADHSFFSE